VSEFFSDQLGVHVKKAQRQRAESGLPVGPIPFGYRSPESGKVPLEDERETQAIKEVFLRRDEGQSYGEIAAWINTQGFRTREGHAFTPHAVKDMLNNPKTGTSSLPRELERLA
jgi:site-specific DNA recombinase